MAFSPSFGSVGDFLSITILIKDIIVALDDSRGSSHKYQKLKQGLEVLGATLPHIEQAYQNPELVVSNDTSATAAHIVSQIQQCLATFNSQKFQKYATSLSPGGSNNALKKTARKIQFKLDQKDIENFQQEITYYNTLLTMLMDVSLMHTIQRSNDELVRQISAIATQIQELRQENARDLSYFVSFGRTASARLNLIPHSVANIHKSIPRVQSLVSSILTRLEEIRFMVTVKRIQLLSLYNNHFVLEDATGDLWTVPLDAGLSRDRFEIVLQMIFEGRPGAHRVARGKYILSDRATSKEVDRNNSWENLFQPNQQILMSIICKAQETVEDVDKSTTCPFCGRESASGMDVEVQCQNCNLFYKRVIHLEDEHNLTTAPMPPQQRRGSDSENAFKDDLCPRAKQRKRQDNDRQEAIEEAIDEAESESDEEDYRGFNRIVLVSRRKRRVSGSIFANFWDIGMNEEAEHVEINEITSYDTKTLKSGEYQPRIHLAHRPGALVALGLGSVITDRLQKGRRSKRMPRNITSYS